MAATKDQMSAAIEPGSIPYGGRGVVEDAIPTQGSHPGAVPSPGPGGDPLNIPGDPLSLLESGAIPSDPSIPVTAGMSVGPGPGPVLEEEAPGTYLADRLRVIAAQAKTPALRAQARVALKLLAKNGAL